VRPVSLSCPATPKNPMPFIFRLLLPSFLHIICRYRSFVRHPADLTILKRKIAGKQ
jgi:hypothetical protein